MAKDWKKNARKLSDEEMKQRFGALEGAGVAGSGPETDPEFVGETIETLKDVAVDLPQSTSLETLDDLIETVSPETADQYRQAVSEARERSPFATFMGGFLAPNPLTKLKAAGKIGSMAPEIATSAAMQYGTEGEVDPMTTAVEATLGKAGEKVLGKVLVGDRVKRRALGMGGTRPRALKRYERKAGGVGLKEDILKIDVSDLEDAGLFQAGIVEFDPKSMKFKSTKKGIKGAVKEKILPPSTKEINRRLLNARDSIGKEIDTLITKSRNNKVMSFPEAEFELDDMYTRYLGDLDVVNDKVLDDVRNDVMKRLMKKRSNKDSINLKDINEVKKNIYKIIGDKRYEKAFADNPDKMMAYTSMAEALADVVRNNVDDPKLIKLNDMFGNVSTMRKNILDKIDQEFTDPAMRSSMALGSPMYRAARTIEESREDLLNISAQGSKVLQDNPTLENYLRGIGAKTIPTMMSDKNSEQNRGPQSVGQLKLQLSKTKLPRTTEGIIQNKAVLLAKVAQQVPEYFEQVRFVLDERPEDIEQMLPMIIKMVPQAFESDKYGRVDGKIMNPLMQQKAREDLMEDERLSNTQRVQMIDRLNRTNTLEDY